MNNQGELFSHLAPVGGDQHGFEFDLVPDLQVVDYDHGHKIDGRLADAFYHAIQVIVNPSFYRLFEAAHFGQLGNPNIQSSLHVSSVHPDEQGRGVTDNYFVPIALGFSGSIGQGTATATEYQDKFEKMYGNVTATCH
jgi:hypothetical protein